MAITINISPELEQRLREEAARAGMEPEPYIVATLEEHLSYPSPVASHLQEDEVTLLQKVDLGISAETWSRYHALLAKRKAETLSEGEQQELISISDEIEEANAQRMQYLVQLAKVRHTTLEQLLSDLGLSSG